MSKPNSRLLPIASRASGRCSKPTDRQWHHPGAVAPGAPTGNSAYLQLSAFRDREKQLTMAPTRFSLASMTKRWSGSRV